MTWRARIGDQGSFRGASFYVDSDDTTLGRRTVTHEYPLRDQPYTEDLGRQAREYRLTAYVLGPDYDRARDALMSALDQPGPGTLVHPYLGRMQVVVTRAHKRETTREGGMARFTLTFTQAGPAAQPAVTADTSRQTRDAADAATDAAQSHLSESVSWLGQTEALLGESRDRLADALAPLDRARGVNAGTAGTLAGAIRTPANFAAQLTGAFSGLRTTALQAIGVYETLFDAVVGSDPPSVPTPSRLQQQRNEQTYQHYIRAQAAISSAHAISQTDFASADQALATGGEVTHALDRSMRTLDATTDTGDRLYHALAALHAQTSEDVRIRAAKLPRLAYTELHGPMPALVAAHHIYGDARRADALADRNHVPNPNFMPQGVTLEYLDDAA